jgi:hypothetical protein
MGRMDVDVATVPSESEVQLLVTVALSEKSYGKVYGKSAGFPSRCYTTWDAITMIPRPQA